MPHTRFPTNDRPNIVFVTPRTLPIIFLHSGLSTVLLNHSHSISPDNSNEDEYDPYSLLLLKFEHQDCRKSDVLNHGTELEPGLATLNSDTSYSIQCVHVIDTAYDCLSVYSA